MLFSCCKLTVTWLPFIMKKSGHLHKNRAIHFIELSKKKRKERKKKKVSYNFCF
jgi:hypothetical protein